LITYLQKFCLFRFLLRNANIVTLFGFSLFFFLSTISPDVENSFSEKTVPGGAQ